MFPNNDIALLKLDREVLIGDYVRPVCLPNGEEPRVGDKCYATGYGLTCKLCSTDSKREVTCMLR